MERGSLSEMVEAIRQDFAMMVSEGVSQDDRRSLMKTIDFDLRQLAHEIRGLAGQLYVRPLGDDGTG